MLRTQEHETDSSAEEPSSANSRTCTRIALQIQELAHEQLCSIQTTRAFNGATNGRIARSPKEVQTRTISGTSTRIKTGREGEKQKETEEEHQSLSLQITGDHVGESERDGGQRLALRTATAAFRGFCY